MARRQQLRGTDGFDDRDEWVIQGPNGQTRIAKYSYGPLALGEAQDIAYHTEGNDPPTLRVLRRALVGNRPAVPIYRVDRDEEGTVLTYTLSRED